MKGINRSIITIFSVSLIITLAFFYTGNGIHKSVIHQRMIKYSIASAREEDGAENRVVMIGNSGYLGESNVYLKYLEDGYIHLFGANIEDQSGWKKLSEFVLEPGSYTLTGMSNIPENVIALQLRISDNADSYQYYYQYDNDLTFTIEQQTNFTLHVMVYPLVENVNVIARPAVYKEREDGTQ